MYDFTGGVVDSALTGLRECPLAQDGELHSLGLHPDGLGWAVSCTCGLWLHGRAKQSKESLVAAWNRRAPALDEPPQCSEILRDGGRCAHGAEVCRVHYEHAKAPALDELERAVVEAGVVVARFIEANREGHDVNGRAMGAAENQLLEAAAKLARARGEGK